MQVGSRKDLANVVPTIWSDIALLMKSTTAARSPLLRKFIVKLSQRIGLTCLPHRSSSWHYQVCLFFRLNPSVCILLLCSCLLNTCPGFLCVSFNVIFSLGPISTWVVINITLLHKEKLISSNDDENLSMIYSVAPNTSHIISIKLLEWYHLEILKEDWAKQIKEWVPYTMYLHAYIWFIQAFRIDTYKMWIQDKVEDIAP